jgi:hypothetical protein
MALTVSVVEQGETLYVGTVAATADADATIDVPHGLGAAPLDVSILPLQAAARISNWVVTAIGAVNITLAKTTDVGSGAAGPQLRVTAKLPHSIVR